MTRRDLINNLIDLSGKTPSRIAEEAGLSRSGVLRWLKGGSDLGNKAQDKLLSVLGVSGGTLASDRVHLWTNDPSLKSLCEILVWSNEEFETVVLIYDSVPIQNFICLFGPLKSIRILVRQTISPMLPPSDPTIPCVIRRHPAIRIEHDLFDQINSHKKIPIDEFDRFFKCVRSRKVEEEIPTKQGKSLTSKELKEILTRAKDWSVDSGVLREDIRTLIEHIESQEEK